MGIMTTDNNNPPTLFLMVGLPGSGKTTLAKQLAVEHKALRLTPDEWIPVLYGDGLGQAMLDSVRDPVEAMQWQVAAQALALGVNVILDFGFWGRGERDEYRARAAALGAQRRFASWMCPTKNYRHGWRRVTPIYPLARFM